MDSQTLTRIEIGSKSLRLRTLILLRWLAVAGQSVAVVGVHVGLGFELPLLPCVGLIVLSAWLNIYLHLRYLAQTQVSPIFAVILLGYDIVQLAGLLYLTGGLENPFSMLLLVPVVVSASTLPLAHTLMLSALMIGCANLLAFQHFPLPWFDDVDIAIPLLYLIGIWTALVATLAFMAIYTYRIAEESRLMSQALSATEMVMAREQKLAALDGLAAAAAHELGTPLGTISLVAKELQRSAEPDSSLGEDVALLKSQADRCRDILAKLTSLGESEDTLLTRMSLGHLIEEVAAPHRDFGKEIRIVLTPAENADTAVRQPIGRRNPAIIYGLGNIIENAVDFAESQVIIEAVWDTDTVKISIKDDGRGFQPEVLSRLGEPYITVRPANPRHAGADEESGLGLGVFIAKTLLERSGARVELRNRTHPHHGAVVEIIWQRQFMDDEPGPGNL